MTVTAMKNVASGVAEPFAVLSAHWSANEDKACFST